MENRNELILYSTPSGEVKVELLFENETFWITQKGMGELFGVAKSTISEHLKSIYESNELVVEATVRNFRTVRVEGAREVTRNIEFYNLDVIIAVGYRVNSSKATQFRIWATNTLKEYIIKGFVLDDARMKNGKVLGKDYFRELLERVRSIRASERRVWLQITDIFAECSIDYDKNSDVTKEFFATVQNKFHYAITGMTAAEIRLHSASLEKPNMGLKTWKNAPKGRVLKSDTTIAKNFLEEKDIKSLERTVTSYFDYIEGIIERGNSFTMEQFAESVNKFLEFNEYKVLDELGRVSRDKADKKVGAIYDEFNKTQKIESDFEKEIKRIQKLNE